MIYLWNVWFMVIKGATCSLFFLWRWCMIPIWNQILFFFNFFFWACEGSKNACYIQLVAPLKFRPFIIFLCPFGMYQYGNNLVAVLLIGFFSCFVLGCLPWQMSCSFYFFFFFFLDKCHFFCTIFQTEYTGLKWARCTAEQLGKVQRRTQLNLYIYLVLFLRKCEVFFFWFFFNACLST